MKIYKSNFTDEERELWDALIKKGKVAPEDNQEEMEDDAPAFPPKKPAQKAEGVETQKSATPPELQAALERMEGLAKSLEMKEYTEIAKRFEPLGENVEELAKTLYDMKHSAPDMYDKYVGVLEKSLEMQNQGGLFREIGKSAGGYSAATGVEAKADMKAQEIMKSHPDMCYDDAIAKAWEDPELMAEYDNEYNHR